MNERLSFPELGPCFYDLASEQIADFSCDTVYGCKRSLVCENDLVTKGLVILWFIGLYMYLNVGSVM